MSTYPIVREVLAQLIAFDTTSRLSNLALIEWVEAKLEPIGAVCRRIPNAEGTKANLWVRIGPVTPGGIVLSGHTDVVPVDGQDWHSDPFTLSERDGLLYGRGTCDMKGFIALCLAFAPEFAKLNLSKPIHFAFSYDEEVGCQGAPDMIAQLVEHGARPDAIWVGEPSLWTVVSGNKGIMVTDVDVYGHEAHSSQPHLGVSANAIAVDLMGVLRGIERNLTLQGSADSPFDPPYPTLTIGEIRGGTAHNILARHCHFGFDLRCPPGFDPDEILQPFFDAVKQADQAMKAQFSGCRIDIHRIANVPPLAPDPENAAEILVRALTGDNALRAVAYATEAGQFHAAGLASVICGPGSIDQAHKPNEFIDPAQLEQGVSIFEKLVSRMSAGG